MPWPLKAGPPRTLQLPGLGANLCEEAHCPRGTLNLLLTYDLCPWRDFWWTSLLGDISAPVICWEGAVGGEQLKALVQT